MTDAAPEKATKPVPPPLEWVVETDMDSVRKAIAGMLRKRRTNMNALSIKIGSSPSWLSDFMSERQNDMRLSSLLRIAEGGDFEVVIREAPKVNKTRRRLREFKQERQRLKEAPAKRPEADPMDEFVDRDDPDRALKVSMLQGMKDPDRRRELEELFAELRQGK